MIVILHSFTRVGFNLVAIITKSGACGNLPPVPPAEQFVQFLFPVQNVY